MAEQYGLEDNDENEEQCYDDQEQSQDIREYMKKSKGKQKKFKAERRKKKQMKHDLTNKRLIGNGNDFQEAFGPG